MIKHLDGIKETVDFDELQGILVYDNIQEEDYPNHWHSSLEIIMPKENEYKVEIGETEYILKPGDIMLIAPGVLHHLSANQGRRTIILVDFSSLNTISKAVNPILSFIHPALLITKETNPSEITLF